jgi:hypothetical protein
MRRTVGHIMLAGCLLLAGFGVGLAAEKVSLKAPVQLGDQWRVTMQMQLTGTLQIRNGEQNLNFTLAAQAKHQLTERVLRVNVEAQPVGMARYYDQAEATITVQGVNSQRGLRSDRRLIVTQQQGDNSVTFAPAGPLTREELELTGEHLDLLALQGVLPTQEVAVGETWEIPLPAAQGLTHFDGVTQKQLVGKLESVSGDTATIAITGTVEGIVRGAEGKVTVDSKLTYSFASKRLTGGTWKHKTERQAGPATPPVTMESQTTVQWSPGTSPELSDEKVASIPQTAGPEHLLLHYRDAKGRFTFQHGRHWQVVAQNEKVTVLRWLELGELKAQLNIHPWTPPVAGQRITAEEVRQFVTAIPGLTVDKVLHNGETPAAPGLWIYRYTVQGNLQQVAVIQSCYAVAGPNGEQALFLFTIETDHAKELEGLDQGLVNTVRFGGQ